MKNQALFSSKDKSKKLKCSLLQYLFGVSRVNRLLLTDILSVARTGELLKRIIIF